MYAEYLRLFGFRVIEIGETSAAQALAITADVIVTGLRVAGPFDGIELIRRLRADDRTTDRPIVVLTACAWDADREAAEQAGCAAFLAKPCLPERLLGEIRRVLRKRRARSPIAGGRGRVATVRLTSGRSGDRADPPFRRRG